MSTYVLALDQGITGSRAILFGHEGGSKAWRNKNSVNAFRNLGSLKTLTLHFPMLDKD